MKLCAWKILTNAVPTRANLRSRGIDAKPRCCFCKKREESSVHLIWNCNLSKKVCAFFLPNVFDLFRLCREDWSSLDCWDWIDAHLNEEEKSRAIIIIWSLWTCRNSIIAKDCEAFYQELKPFIVRYIEEDGGAFPSPLSLPSDSQASHESWSPPPLGVWKLNVDAAWREDLGFSGIGWSICDFSGCLICAGRKKCKHQWQIKSLEAFAILEGLKGLKKYLKIPPFPLMTESDSSAAIKMLNKEDVDLTEVSNIVASIEEMAQNFSVISC